MSQNKGYYSLVQFCPDASRLEGVNIGVVLYSSIEKRLRVQMAPTNHRIRKFFGNQDWAFVNRAKKSIERQLTNQHFPTVNELDAYISKRANVIHLTPLRPMRISDLETDTNELHDRLVGQDPLDRKRRVDRFLTERFMEAGVVGLVEKSVSIDIPDVKRSIRVPYAYQNGRFNLISPVQFDLDREDIFAKMGRSAIEGQVLHNRTDPTHGELHLVVVANFATAIEDSLRDFVRKTFENHSVTLHTFDNLDPLVEDIRRSAVAHSSQSAE